MLNTLSGVTFYKSYGTHGCMVLTDVDSQKVFNLIKAHQNSLQFKIMQFLSIYPQLSTKELALKLNKSKQTVLRQIDELIKLKIVDMQEIDDGKTPFPKRIYYLNEKNSKLSVRGQEIKSKVFKDNMLLKEFNAYRLATYLGVKQIIDAMVRYQKRLNQITESSTPEEMIELMKDNLGGISTTYLSHQQMAKKDGVKNYEKYDNNTKDYLQIKLLLPIRRLLDIDSQSEWTKDGRLWYYEVE